MAAFAEALKIGDVQGKVGMRLAGQNVVNIHCRDRSPRLSALLTPRGLGQFECREFPPGSFVEKSVSFRARAGLGRSLMVWAESPGGDLSAPWLIADHMLGDSESLVLGHWGFPNARLTSLCLSTAQEWKRAGEVKSGGFSEVIALQCSRHWQSNFGTCVLTHQLYQSGVGFSCECKSPQANRPWSSLFRT